MYFLSFIHWFPSQDFPLFIWLLLDIALSLYSFASLLSFSVTKLGYFWRVFGIIFLTVVSRCGSVGKAVTYNTRDPRFISSHQQFLFTINCNKNCIEKSIIKKMPLFKKKQIFSQNSPKIWQIFGLIWKAPLKLKLLLLLFGQSLKSLGYFLFQHLVTLFSLVTFQNKPNVH